MFDKSADRFPVKERYAFLSHCGIAPLYAAALRRMHDVGEAQSRTGALVYRQYPPILDELHAAAAQLLRTSPDNVAFVKNTSEGIGLIAGGYPFRPGDQVISYVHEYPANHYPWRLQERRGVELVLLPDRDTTGAGAGADGRPVGWTMDDLERCVTPRTRVVALSHVQFASGYLADLAVLGDFCRARDIDLVLDVAQSVGCVPFYPEELHVAAAVSSGWKWLLGPMGTGLCYTSEQFRARLEPVLVGADTMRQGTDYLDHTWAPHASARQFEYSTVPITLAAALACCLRELPLRHGVEAIAAEIARLQDVFLAKLDRDRIRPVFAAGTPRSPIISLAVPDAAGVARAMLRENIILTERGGYLRVAPHFYNTEDEVERAAGLLNELARRG